MRFNFRSGLVGGLICASLAQPVHAELPDLAQLKLAAESGDASAEFAYSQDIQSSNRADSDRWLEKSANQGFAPAEKAWGDRCEQQQGVEPKHKRIQMREAVRWTSRAAYQGLPSAQRHLGMYYAEGAGLPKDPVAGYMWLQIALNNPATDLGTKVITTSYLNHLIANMSSSDIAEGQRRAAEFQGSPGPGINPVEADLIFGQLRLSSVMSTQGHPTAFVNNTALAAGQSKEVRLEGMSVRLDCIAVTLKSVELRISGTDHETDLIMR
jgi:hypothetical protein